ncbi:MAG: Mrp/NBP35 family ATP-binding protein [Lachnospiraceae bacterium]|nr:Mrp/NBP35 family ATP-binding protein [Lachnospiraceae bacterium]
MSEEIKNQENAECTHDCSTCSLNCSSKQTSHEEHHSANNDLQAPLNAQSHVKRVIGVVSGKGGVGKSLVTSLLAATMQKNGRAAAILDADITGPSIPKAFGVKGPAYANDMGIVPVTGKSGVKIMSVNLLMEQEDAPVVWRGPVIAGTVKQFWTDVVWGDVDYMFVDMPPGTGDVPLMVFQSLPLDGIVIVTSPQDLVSMIVGKAVNMARMMNIPILGIVENYSYMECPHCGEKLSVFGESHIEDVAAKYETLVLAKLPIRPDIAALVDAGKVEEADLPEILPAAQIIERQMALV